MATAKKCTVFLSTGAGIVLSAVIALCLTVVPTVFARQTPTQPPAAALSVPDSLPPLPPLDSVMMPFPVQQTVPRTYEELMSREFTADLSTPSNIRTTTEFDPETGCYIVRTRVGETDISTPFLLTPAQYRDWATRQSMAEYYRRRNSLLNDNQDTNKALSFLDLKTKTSGLEKIFGPGGVRLRTRGTATISAGIKTTKTDNPALSLSSRRHTFLDFDQKIQATLEATVGERLSFNMNYNTDATFDFDSKNLKLQYQGTEDDIVKNIEAGNVSLTTGSQLIRGATALFGVKSTLQFGRLTATALVSQQNSESRSVSAKGGVQTSPFSIACDNYDYSRHFFLAQYFRDTYNASCARLPYVASGIKITRVEIWVTNKSGNYNQSRNLVAFMDLGENKVLANHYWRADESQTVPSNQSNNLLQTIKADYAGARDINSVTQVLAPLTEYGIEGGRDYEKIESARLLTESEYTLNSTLGYVSLNARINSDEVLGVAFEYTYQGKVYQVGEFSADITDTASSLYVKMLKGTDVSVGLPSWRLMMKNVYSLGAYQVEKSNFRLQVKYLSDTTGTEIVYLPGSGLADKPLLQITGLDRLNSNLETGPDGFFDFIDGYTILPASGKIVFPVVEPFGADLAAQIGNPAIAQRFTYPELYDSTLVVARQFAYKNKFVLTGEYQASAGSQIRLNAMNVPRGSVIVTAGGVVLTENADYTVDYSMGIVTITNQSIIDSGQPVNVTLENQSMFATQRKTLLGLDLSYRFNPSLTLGATVLHYSEKALTEKVNIGEEVVKNTMWGLNLSYNKQFMWLTDLLNRIPTVNAVQPSSLTVQAEVARLQPHRQGSGSNAGSSYIDDFESAQSGIDLRSPYSWFLASTPYDSGSDALFPEAALSNNVDYGKNRALLNWYYIDRLFTSRNSSLCPGYIKNDARQLSNPYVREITSREIYPDRQLTYGESATIQTLNLSFYPTERGPYNLDAEQIDASGALLNPEKRWGGIMRRLDNTNFEQSNIEYLQFWLLNPFLDPDNPNQEGGDLYFNFGDISEDILKDGMKSYENGVPVDGKEQFMRSTVWGRVSSQNSLTYAFDNNTDARAVQDVGLDGLRNADEFTFSSYADYLERFKTKLSPAALDSLSANRFSPLNDPAGDNYHFFRGHDYDEEHLGILERYKRYNGVEGNSLSPADTREPLYQSSRNTPDVEDINQDNTLNEYERYYQYRVSIRPSDLVVGKNYITDRQVSIVSTREGEKEVEWFQFKIPLSDFQKVVGSINGFSTIRFARIFMTGFRRPTHLRFASLELVRGEWRPYEFDLSVRGDAPATGRLDISTVNIEENSGRTPVNYVLPPGVSRITDPGQSQIVQLNEQSLSMKAEGLQPGESRAIYRLSSHDLRNYRRLQMWVHAEKLIDDATRLRNGELALFVRLGTDARNNFYEYEIPLELTPHGHYTDSRTDREEVWPQTNRLDLLLQSLVDLKKERNRARREGVDGVGFATLYSGRDPANERNRMSVLGNPSLSDVRFLMIGVRNNSSTPKDGIVWINELKVTDFNADGGWGADASATLAMSDIAMLNMSTHIETAGFGAVDQALNERRMDDYTRYSVAVQADLGRFAPRAAALKAPVYYSYSSEKTSPKYNPLDSDVLLKDALADAGSEQARDSIRAMAMERLTVTSFSLSGLNSGVRSRTPKPWDPANFTLNYSFNKQSRSNPTTDHEYTNDYRGSFQYAYTPFVRPLKPFARMKSRSRHTRFLREWELNWLPSSIAFITSMSRYYYELQARNDADSGFGLPPSVNKNFLWDRQLALTWNVTRSLNLTFNSNTSARIDEPMGVVNRRLFPDRYREWRDTVWRSILHMGTPWAYNQTFTATYRAPFSRIPALDFLTANLTYNSAYRWDRGATVEGMKVGNTVANQGAIGVDGRINLESLYNKNAYLKRVNTRFGPRRPDARGNNRRQQRRFERTVTLNPDTSTVVNHNLRAERVTVRAADVESNVPVTVRTRTLDSNTIEILDRGERPLRITVREVEVERSGFWSEVADHAARLAMSLRGVSLRWRNTKNLSLPLFLPDVGNIFGQSRSYGPMSPGIDFAFGFTGEGFVDRALRRGWVMTGSDQTSPAIFSRTAEVNLELTLEPVRGLKILLTGNRTDNRTKQMQIAQENMPVVYAGSFTKTHCAIATAFSTAGNATNGYSSAPFDAMLENIPVIASRIEQAYGRTRYPSSGFMAGSIHAGEMFSPEVGTVSPTSSDVLIPAFLAAYTGVRPQRQYLSPFPSFARVLPNWRVTYDGLIAVGNLSRWFKAVTLSHAYQCTYSVGSYSSYLNWISADGGQSMGFTLDAVTGRPIPSSPYNISSVAITERFAPLIGAALTLRNDMTVNAEMRIGRTLTLNTSAGQVVEATQSGFTAGVGYKIVGFNNIIKIRGRQTGISNDLTVSGEFSYMLTQALIRRIETDYTQATSGSRTIAFNLAANYVLSRRMTVGLYVDHQVNTPIVTNAAFPTTNTAYGLTFNIALAR